jgi:hypothetical protein
MKININDDKIWQSLANVRTGDVSLKYRSEYYLILRCPSQ